MALYTLKRCSTLASQSKYKEGWLWLVVVGVDGVVWQKCAISIRSLLLEFSLLELLLVFAIFAQIVLVSRFCGQVAYWPPQVLPKGGFVIRLQFGRSTTWNMSHNKQETQGTNKFKKRSKNHSNMLYVRARGYQGYNHCLLTNIESRYPNDSLNWTT